MSDFWRSARTRSMHNFEIWCVTAIKTPDCLLLDLLPLVTWTLAAVDLRQTLEAVTPSARTCSTETSLVPQGRGGEGMQPEQGDQPGSKAANPHLPGHQPTSSCWKSFPFAKHRHTGFHSTALSKPLSGFLQACGGKDCFREFLGENKRGFFHTNCYYFAGISPGPANIKHIGSTTTADKWHLLPLQSIHHPRRHIPQNNPEAPIWRKHIHGQNIALPPCNVPHTIQAEAVRTGAKWPHASSSLTNTIIHILLDLQGSNSCFVAQLMPFRQQSPPSQRHKQRWDRQRQAGDTPTVPPAMLSTEHEKQHTAKPSQEGHTQSPPPPCHPHTWCLTPDLKAGQVISTCSEAIASLFYYPHQMELLSPFFNDPSGRCVQCEVRMCFMPLESDNRAQGSMPAQHKNGLWSLCYSKLWMSLFPVRYKGMLIDWCSSVCFSFFQHIMEVHLKIIRF